ncbi:MAG: potassium channel family protein [Woeseiaceae bacterium]|nr:potassium channel family protein [Woeseiaceae bacterium]
MATLAFPLAATLLGAFVLQVVTTAILLSALYAVVESRRLFRVMAVLMVPTILVNWFADPANFPYLDGLGHVATMTFFVVTLGAILANIVNAKRVTADVIFGSIAAYLLFGVVMALAFQFLNTLDPGNVISSVSDTTELSQRAALSDFLYFSFITLTSVGYGDIAPVGQAARSLAMFEGIFGQMYVAILIAMLVSVHISQKD